MPIMTTGQITIVDANDARSIYALLQSNQGTQQVYTNEDSQTTYQPSWFTSPLTITVKLGISGLTDAQAWARVKTRNFRLSPAGAQLTTASTSTSFANNADVVVSTPFTVTYGTDWSTTIPSIQISANLLSSVGQVTIYFDAIYTDQATGLDTPFQAQITLNTLKTGTNAAFVVVRGREAIEEATGAVKNATAIAAELVRGSGVDTSNVAYRFYEAASPITASTSGVATKFGFKSTAWPTLPTGSNGELNVNIPAATTLGWSSNNTLVIGEAAVPEVATFRAEIGETMGNYASDPTISFSGGGGTGATAAPVRVGNRLVAIRVTAGGSGYATAPTVTISLSGGATATAQVSAGAVTAITLDNQSLWSTFFTVYDISDPYDIEILSQAGNVFKPSLGGTQSTVLTPRVRYGSSEVGDISAWTFRWRLFDRDGTASFFVNASKTPTGGCPVSVQSGTGQTAAITVSTPFTSAPVAGEIIKFSPADGSKAVHAQVAASPTPTTTQFTLAAPSGNNLFLVGQANEFTSATANALVGSSAFICVAGSAFDGSTIGGTVVTTGTAGVTVRGDDIDAKGRIECTANRP